MLFAGKVSARAEGGVVLACDAGWGGSALHQPQEWHRQDGGLRASLGGSPITVGEQATGVFRVP